MLHSKEINRTEFIECGRKNATESFNRRWLLTMSVLAQKFLNFVAKPLAATGNAIEYWLNLVSCNRNLGGLIWNSIRGEMIRPEKASAEYLSFTGSLDKRVELDKTIVECGDRYRYNSLLSIMAAKASYENHAYLQYTVTDLWKMELLGSFDFWNDYQQKHTTQAFILGDKKDDHDLIVVAFRGTETFDADAWSSDVDLSWYEIPGLGKVHGGFMKALGLHKNKGCPPHVNDRPNNQEQPLAYYVIKDILKQALESNNKTKFIVTGHSLGGALAVLFAALLIKHEERELLGMLEGVYTYGQPRVGDKEFGEIMEKKLEKYEVKYYRTVYCNDIVPRLPYDDSTMMFKHFGKCLYFDSFYIGKIVDEEPNKNYFSLLSAIPKLVNAGWEIIRSFVIPYTKGADYSESFLLKMYRLIGLMIAGVPAHGLQDYVNVVRLGSDLYKDYGIMNNTETKVMINE
ncbi:triacylglycerol lipase OBL1-like [Rutidosis leptorrhynchoides]|uniref:triacylglycerol lipase OBL1-like n=1 Tax=Rutidosis leptorrhynchoides TaxID=125765 RepID=UPI003A9970FC